MKSTQYTIRQVPEQLDKALRRKAKRTGKSLNKVVLESLAESAGVQEEAAKYHDLDHLAGTWVNDKKFDDAIKDFEQIDEDAWQ